MLDLRGYNEEKFKIMEGVKSYINKLQKCYQISQSSKLPLNFNEYIEKLDKIIQSLSDDKVRISVIAEVSNGKSTFLNALVFKDKILEARIGETTARLYHISYAPNYFVKYKGKEQRFSNLEEIKEYIKNLNEETLKKAETQKETEGKVLTISEDELSVYIYMPLENLKHGIEIIDTPGFGTLKEELMMKFIQKAINESDAVITVFDISQGMKKSEYEKFSKLLAMIRPDKRYIVFNKVDAHEEESENFERVGRDVINKMNKILKEQNYSGAIEPKQLFYLSAKLALQGFMGLNDERVQKYKKKFEEFEEVFWNDVINYKQNEFLSTKRETFKRVKKIVKDEIDSIYKNLSEQLQALKSEKESVLREQEKINKMAVSLENKAIKYISKLKEIKVNTYEIMEMIKEKILEKSKVIRIIDEEFNAISAVFGKKELEEKINSALSSVNMEDTLKEVMEQYYKPVFSKIREYIEDYNNEVERYNSELEKMNIKKFKFPKVEFEERKVEAKSFKAQFQVEGVDILGSILRGIISGLAVRAMLGVVARSAVLGSAVGIIAGPIGIAIGLLFAVWDIASKTKQKKEELKQKIIQSIENSLYDVKQEIEKLNDVVRDAIDLIRSKFNESKFITSEIIKMLERGDLDEKIKELEAQISGLNEINKILAGG
jgi:urease gamma subunit